MRRLSVRRQRRGWPGPHVAREPSDEGCCAQPPRKLGDGPSRPLGVLRRGCGEQGRRPFSVVSMAVVHRGGGCGPHGNTSHQTTQTPRRTTRTNGEPPGGQPWTRARIVGKPGGSSAPCRATPGASHPGGNPGRAATAAARNPGRDQGPRAAPPADARRSSPRREREGADASRSAPAHRASPAGPPSRPRAAGSAVAAASARRPRRRTFPPARRGPVATCRPRAAKPRR